MKEVYNMLKYQVNKVTRSNEELESNLTNMIKEHQKNYDDMIQQGVLETIKLLTLTILNLT
jgi:hypothetical protein